MLFRKIDRKLSKLGIVPLLVAILSLFFIKDLGPYYLHCFDPAYNYLLNGLNLALGEMEIGHTDHPGTPLQLLSALVIRFTFFFMDDKQLMDSVLTYPETYLFSISLFLLILHVIALYILGFFVYKHSNSIPVAVFLQLGLPVSLQAFFNVPRVQTESLLGLWCTLLIAVTFVQVFSRAKFKQHLQILLFSILSALLITTKVSAAGLLVLPLFILPGVLNKLKYIALTTVFTSLVLVPIYSKLGHFADFITRIFTHLGSYGQGSEGLPEMGEYLANIRKILSAEVPFTLAYVAVLVTCIMLVFRKVKVPGRDRRPEKLMFAVFLVMSLQILVVARQYSFHYMLPAYSLAFLGIFAVYKVVSGSGWLPWKFNLKKLSPMLWILMAVIFARAIVHFQFFPDLSHPAKKTGEFLKNHSQKAIVILAERYKDTALPEQAFYFGTSYSGYMKDIYRQWLKKKYPATYFYDAGENLAGWDENLMKEELMQLYPELLLYLKYNSANQHQEFLNTWMNLYLPDSLYTSELIYENSLTNESVYLLETDTSAAGQFLKPSLTICCDMEQLAADTAYLADKSLVYQFDKAFLRSTNYVYSGKHSLKLNTQNPYGADMDISVRPGDFLRIRAWRYSKENSGLLVVSGKSGDFYRAGARQIAKADSGWEFIELAFYLPKSYLGEYVSFYLWQNGQEDVYFDDIRIEIYRRDSKH